MSIVKPSFINHNNKSKQFRQGKTMNNKNHQKKWRQLDIYLMDLNQGIIMIGDDSQLHREFINDYQIHLALKRRVAYINFNQIESIRSLAECFLEQYSLLFGTAPTYYDPSNELGLLDFSVELFSNINDEEYTYIWLENFTEVRQWEDADNVYRILRSIFQHQEKVVHVFTSHNIKEVHNIFSDYDNPFFRFAVAIEIEE